MNNYETARQLSECLNKALQQPEPDRVEVDYYYECLGRALYLLGKETVNLGS